MFQRLFLQAYQLGCFHRKSGELLLLSFSLVLIWIRIGRLVFADGKYKKAKNLHVFYVQLKAFFINVYNSLTVHALIYQADQKAFPESPLKASPFSWTPSTTDCPCCHLSSWPESLLWVTLEGESIFPKPLEPFYSLHCHAVHAHCSHLSSCRVHLCNLYLPNIFERRPTYAPRWVPQPLKIVFRYTKGALYIN